MLHNMLSYALPDPVGLAALAALANQPTRIQKDSRVFGYREEFSACATCGNLPTPRLPEVPGPYPYTFTKILYLLSRNGFTNENFNAPV